MKELQIIEDKPKKIEVGSMVRVKLLELNTEFTRKDKSHDYYNNNDRALGMRGETWQVTNIDIKDEYADINCTDFGGNYKIPIIWLESA